MTALRGRPSTRARSARRSPAYVPASLKSDCEQLAEVTKTVSHGDVTDFSHFGGAVINAKAFAKHRALLSVPADPHLRSWSGRV